MEPLSKTFNKYLKPSEKLKGVNSGTDSIYANENAS